MYAKIKLNTHMKINFACNLVDKLKKNAWQHCSLILNFF